jgi:hypothetical protein
MGEMVNIYIVVVGKPERTSLSGRSWGKWQDNIKMDLKMCEAVDQSHVAQDRIQWRGLVNMVMKFRVSLNAENFLSG